MNEHFQKNFLLSQTTLNKIQQSSMVRIHASHEGIVEAEVLHKSLLLLTVVYQKLQARLVLAGIHHSSNRTTLKVNATKRLKSV